MADLELSRLVVSMQRSDKDDVQIEVKRGEPPVSMAALEASLTLSGELLRLRPGYHFFSTFFIDEEIL